MTDFAATIPNASPSMRLDHLARRPSEIDAINGQVVALSREVGLEAPYNEALCAVLRHRESLFARAPALIPFEGRRGTSRQTGGHLVETARVP